MSRWLPSFLRVKNIASALKSFRDNITLNIMKMIDWQSFHSMVIRPIGSANAFSVVTFMSKPSPEKLDPLAEARAIMAKLTATAHKKHEPLNATPRQPKKGVKAVTKSPARPLKKGAGK
jgi:hypothetical protein